MTPARTRHDRSSSLAALLVAGIACVAVHGPAAAKSVALPLERVVQQSSLIARVRVEKTEEAQSPYPRYRSVATVRALEVLRGDPTAETLRVRFDTGSDCPNVHFEAGEECLLFAEEEIDGVDLPVALDNGKKAVSDAAYAALRPEILRPSSRLRHRVSVSATSLADGDLELEVLVKNTGTDPLALRNRLKVEVREPPGIERAMEDVEIGNGPTLIVQLESRRVLRAKELETLRRSISLEANEACRATFRAKELPPLESGRQKLRAWVKLLGALSEPVTLEVDFGMRTLERDRMEGSSSQPDSGPFRLA